MKKLFLSILLLAAFSAVALCGCNNKNAELKRRLGDLEERNSNLEERVEELEKENTELKDRLDDLEAEYLAANSSLTTLEEAYQNGLLNKNDIMHVSYYLTGNVYEATDENWEDKAGWSKVDFAPENDLSELDKAVETAIKISYYNDNREIFKDGQGGYYSPEILKVEFLGEYNLNYVAIINCDLWGYGAVVKTVNIGGIVWERNDGPHIYVFTFDTAAG